MECRRNLSLDKGYVIAASRNIMIMKTRRRHIKSNMMKRWRQGISILRERILYAGLSVTLIPEFKPWVSMQNQIFTEDDILITYELNR